MVSTKDLLGTAAKLEADAKKLREAAAILGLSTGVKHQPAVQPYDGTRSEQLKAYLKRHGPATRQEILSDSGVPPGTVASLLGANKTFRKDHNDLWHIRGTSYLKHQAQEATQANHRQQDLPPAAVAMPLAQQA